MKLSVDSLNSKKVDNIDFDIFENVSNIEYFGENSKLVSPIHMVGKISKAGNNYLLKSNVDFKYLTNCGRCLKEVEVLLKYSIDAYLMKEEYDEGKYEDTDVFKVDSASIDLLEIVLSTLTYNIPHKVLCSDDCKGICLGCGVDLNTEICKCEDSIDFDDIDPRFAKLKELLK